MELNRERQMIDDLIEIFDEEYNKRNLITPQNTAEKLTAKGYRRIDEDYARQCTCYALGCQMAKELKSEVARKIFDDIYERLLQAFPLQSFIDAPCTTHDRIFDLICELKKKYTENRDENL